MALTPLSSVFLDGVQFSTDPKIYELNWQKRNSKHETIGGGKTIQDFGLFGRDMTLRLESADQQWLDQATVDALNARFVQRGVTFVFKDWVGTEAFVFMQVFDPQPTFIRDIFNYRMELQVVTLTKLRGIVYTGG